MQNLTCVVLSDILGIQTIIHAIYLPILCSFINFSVVNTEVMLCLIYQGVYQIQQLPNGQQVYIQQTEVDHSEQDGS